MSVNKGQFISVKVGDCIYSLANKHGLKASTISDHPENKSTLKQRSDPCLLLPGDEIFIPEKNILPQECQTESRYTFRCLNSVSLLKVQFLDFKKPLSKLPFILKASGFSMSGETDDAGFIDVTLPLEVNSASIRIGTPPETFEFDLIIGGLDPENTTSGQQQRLANLGLYKGKIDGDFGDVTKAALHEFQVNNNIKISEIIDSETLEALVKDTGV